MFWYNTSKDPEIDARINGEELLLNPLQREIYEFAKGRGQLPLHFIANSLRPSSDFPDNSFAEEPYFQRSISDLVMKGVMIKSGRIAPSHQFRS